MEISKFNSLVELYFKKCEEVEDKKPFLKWLRPGKPSYSWGDIKEKVYKFFELYLPNYKLVYLVSTILKMVFYRQPLLFFRNKV